MTESHGEQNTDEQRRIEFRRRQLFAQAQEHFAAGDFPAASNCLKEIPESAQTADIARLVQLVRQRLQEIAALHRDIIALREQNANDELLAKLQRLLELQPGDERALALRNQLEEQAHAVSAPTVTPPATSETTLRRRDHRGAQAPRPATITDVEEEIWEFGERMTSVPPPLPGGNRRSRQQPVDDDDLLIPINDGSSMHLWIALAVSGFVILMAVVLTVVVLLIERG